MNKNTLSFSGIYCWKNVVSNKVYIGLSSNVYLRRNVHWNRHLQAAWNKDGEHNFKFEIIEIVDQCKLIEREQYWMDYYKSYLSENGYNNNSISNRTTGYRHTNETKKKIGLASLERDYKLLSDIVKYKIRKSKIGQMHTEETKKKMSSSHKNMFKGYIHSDQSRKNMSDAHKGIIPSFETRKKRSETMKRIIAERRKLL